MTNPQVSVIIPTYNNAQYLSQAIKSILNQTYQASEIIVIDDGSTDETTEVVQSFNKNIQYIRQENKGPASARNTGLKIAKGKYVVFLDADDELLPDKLSFQINFLEENPSIDLVYSNGYRFREDKEGNQIIVSLQKTNEIFIPEKENENYINRLIVKNIFPIHAAMTKITCINEVGGFDESLTACEDWDLWFRISEKCSFQYMNEYLFKYRDSENSNSADTRRNSNEVESVMAKIMNSKSFQDAPKKVISEFFYNRAINCLNLKESEDAIIYFSKAYSLNPLGFNSLISLISTKLLGNDAIKLFMLKRKLFGSRGRRRF